MRCSGWESASRAPVILGVEGVSLIVVAAISGVEGISRSVVAAISSGVEESESRSVREVSLEMLRTSITDEKRHLIRLRITVSLV